MSLIQQFESRLSDYQPRQLGAELPKAGVLMPITRNTARPEVILTRRSSRLSTHSGQVAFPGGKFDHTDETLINTALRETHEELGIAPSSVEVIGGLSQVVSLHGIQVNPFVGLVDHDISVVPSPYEIESVFRVPLDFFLDAQPIRRDRMTYKGTSLAVPSYEYEYQGIRYEIWGLTAIVLVEFLNVAMDARITIFDDYLKDRDEIQPKR
ncbi:hypothetical protein A3762_04615 [Oleiphilus sp. HI0125]|uniref:CoA pyrophosphatase n=1 Tax=Oleiphilus sp. HI0125 TaxID=1822266 RepID=UPI0007C2FE9E|nr:CoA pyrophosphatase [Oleiphilus sp. HI0125]KZZ58237.1 hypothetical protein A3762_18620 [Oleiphilus sp. HI0125]KZZ59665.1 hypothetical protein A3762_04615 [Oleiphilus sp. HI0125]